MLLVASMLLVGCRATQPVVWEYHSPLQKDKGAKVTVSATCPMPEESLTFLREDIQHYVSRVLTGSTDDPSAYTVDVVITRYEEGNVFARLLTFGMVGRIYLEGTVVVREGRPLEDIGRGFFEKWYGTILPISNLISSMDRSVIPKVGLAVSRALEKSTKK